MSKVRIADGSSLTLRAIRLSRSLAGLEVDAASDATEVIALGGTVHARVTGVPPGAGALLQKALAQTTDKNPG